MRTNIKITTVQILARAYLNKSRRTSTRDLIARRILSDRQRTDNPHPILGRVAELVSFV